MSEDVKSRYKPGRLWGGTERLDYRDWKWLQVLLGMPFYPEQVDFRVLRQYKDERGATVAELAAYIDKITVMDRLDKLVGPHNWSYTFEPVVIENVDSKGFEYDAALRQRVPTVVTTRELTKARGTLTIHGVSKSALGTSSKTEPSKGCDSDTFKRCAVMWGIGRYLYSLGNAAVEQSMLINGRVKPQALEQLRARLPAPRELPWEQATPEPEREDQNPLDDKTGFTSENLAVETPEPPAPVVPAEQPAEQPEAKAGPKVKAPTTPENAQAFAVYTKAVQDAKLPITPTSKDSRLTAIAEFIQTTPALLQKAGGVKNLTVQQITALAAAVRAGKVRWGEPVPDEDTEAEAE